MKFLALSVNFIAAIFNPPSFKKSSSRGRQISVVVWFGTCCPRPPIFWRVDRCPAHFWHTLVPLHVSGYSTPW